MLGLTRRKGESIKITHKRTGKTIGLFVLAETKGSGARIYLEFSDDYQIDRTETKYISETFTADDFRQCSPEAKKLMNTQVINEIK